MKLAFARGGMWFATSILVLFFLVGGKFEDEPLQATFLFFGVIGLLFGLLGFCITLYNLMHEDRQLQTEERQKSVGSGGSDIE